MQFQRLCWLDYHLISGVEGFGNKDAHVFVEKRKLVYSNSLDCSPSIVVYAVGEFERIARIWSMVSVGKGNGEDRAIFGISSASLARGNSPVFLIISATSFGA